MAIEHRCPVCAVGAPSVREQRPEREPPRSAGSLTFTCTCGSAATVSTASSPARELARRGWTVHFVAE
jgi:hypothetical protein